MEFSGARALALGQVLHEVRRAAKFLVVDDVDHGEVGHGAADAALDVDFARSPYAKEVRFTSYPGFAFSNAATAASIAVLETPWPR